MSSLLQEIKNGQYCITSKRTELVLLLVVQIFTCTLMRHTFANDVPLTHSYGLPITKVVIWGVKLHSHTHSYIHWAFERAFRHLGYTVYWLDNSDDTRVLIFQTHYF